MNSEQFYDNLARLTPKQRRVLEAFLAGKPDSAIAHAFEVESSTIRRHLTNICRVFGLSNNQGEKDFFLC